MKSERVGSLILLVFSGLCGCQQQPKLPPYEQIHWGNFVGTAPQGHDDVLTVNRVMKLKNHPATDVLELTLTEYVNPKDIRHSSLQGLRDHTTPDLLRFTGPPDRPLQGAVYQLVQSERGVLTETSEWQIWDCIKGCRNAPAHLDYQRSP